MDIQLRNIEEAGDGITLTMTFFMPGVQKAELVKEGLKLVAAEAEVDPKSGNLRQRLEKTMGVEPLRHRLSAFIAQKAVWPVAAERQLDLMFAPEVVKGAIDNLYASDNSTFDVTVILRPHYELSSYEPVTVNKPDLLVTDDMVDAQIKRELGRIATYVDEEGPICEGDVLRANMKTFANGRLEPALSGKNIQIVLTYDMMPRAFVDNVVGMQAGDRKKFEFLAADSEDQMGVPVNFAVALEVLKRTRRIVPELTDELVRTRLSSRDKTVDQFRFRVRQFLLINKQEESADRREQMMDEELGKRITRPIPDKLIERTRDDLYESVRMRASAEGMNMVQYAQKQGMDENQFQMNVTLQARESLRQGLALDALYDHLQLPITDEDREKALAELAPDNVELARKTFDRNDSWFIVDNMAKRLKAHAWLVQTAIIK